MGVTLNQCLVGLHPLARGMVELEWLCLCNLFSLKISEVTWVVNGVYELPFVWGYHRDCAPDGGIAAALANGEVLLLGSMMSFVGVTRPRANEPYQGDAVIALRHVLNHYVTMFLRQVNSTGLDNCDKLCLQILIINMRFSLICSSRISRP